MGFLKRLLGLEKKEEVKDTSDIPIQTLPEPITAVMSKFYCEQCGNPIPEEEVQTFAGKKLHKRCLRRLRKEAKRMAF